MKKKIIWALCDDGEQSVLNSLPKEEYQVISFGIIKKPSVEYLDLSDDIDKIIKVLNKYPLADYIVASPPCIAFSMASCNEVGMNAYMFIDSLKEREKEDYINSSYKYETSALPGMNKKEYALMSKKIVNNILEIINIYKPKNWYIENPRGSLMWNYINSNNYHNVAIYGAYNHPIKKPTIFLSNILLELKTNIEGIKFLKWDKEYTDKSKRSLIPHELLRDIFRQFNKPIPQQLELFKGEQDD